MDNILLKPKRGRIRYLLRDLFTSDLAAGAVNATKATDNVNTRTVTDAESKLSLSGGKLTLSGGKAVPAAGDPGIWFNSMARAAGRLVGANLNLSVSPSTNALTIGFDSNTASDVRQSLMFAAGGEIKANWGASSCIVGTYVTGTDYKIFVVARTNGCFYFILGGIYTYVTLLWVNSVAGQNFTPMYPAISNYNAAFAVDAFSVPQNVFTVKPLVYDTFTRDDGAIGASESTGPDTQSLAARAWTSRIGTWVISTNAAAASVLTAGIGAATVSTPGSADVLITANLTRAGNVVGLVACYQDADNYLRLIHDGTNVKLIERAGGVDTTLKTNAVAYAAGAQMSLRVIGTEVRYYYNLVNINNSNTSLTGTEHGIYTENVGNTFDEFTVWPTGAGSEFSLLARYL